MAMAKRVLTFRLPMDLVQVLELEAANTGKSQTEIVVRALAKQFGLTLPQSRKCSTKPRSKPSGKLAAPGG